MKTQQTALATLARREEPYQLAFWSQVGICAMAVLFPAWLVAKSPGCSASIMGGLACLLGIVSTLLLDLHFRGRRLVHSLVQELSVDPLSGVLSRSAVLQLGERELSRATRSGKPMGVLFVDLDHFKWINDTHGHGAGDEVLRTIGQRLLNEVRGYDAVGRYGGDEFVVILPECGWQSLREISERLRQAVGRPIDISDDQRITVTLSIGGLSERPVGHGLGDLLTSADEALYAAKRGGRNRVALVPRAGELPLLEGGLETQPSLPATPERDLSIPRPQTAAQG